MGRKTNNRAKMYGFLLGLTLAHDMGIFKLIILGDSMITIEHLINGSYPKKKSPQAPPQKNKLCFGPPTLKVSLPYPHKPKFGDRSSRQYCLPIRSVSKGN